MRFLTRTLVCCLAVVSLGLATCSTALAGGGSGSSAGNSQYVDPLHNGGHHHGSGSHGSSSGSSTSTAGSSTLSSSAPSGVGGTASAQGTSRTLPYTGLNLEACVALGLTLLLAGFGLRRVLAAR